MGGDARAAAASPGQGGRRTAVGFDRLSPFYDRLVALFPGDRIPGSQTRFLDRLLRAERALIVGGGTGGFLLALLRAGFRGSVVHLDLSAGMTRRARERIATQAPSRLDGVDFRIGTLADLREHERFDLICTHYFLDLFSDDELSRVMRRLDAALDAGGRWSCADFSAPEGRTVRRLAQTLLIRGLYGFFGLTCGIEARRLPAIGRGFERLGYEPLAQRTLAGGLLWTAVFERRSDGRAASPSPTPLGDAAA